MSYVTLLLLTAFSVTTVYTSQCYQCSYFQRNGKPLEVNNPCYQLHKMYLQHCDGDCFKKVIPRVKRLTGEKGFLVRKGCYSLTEKGFDEQDDREDDDNEFPEGEGCWMVRNTEVCHCHPDTVACNPGQTVRPRGLIVMITSYVMFVQLFI